MKAIFLLLGIIFSVFLTPVNAQTTSEFGYQLHPEKLLENTEGTLQVFVTSNDMMIPKQISSLRVVSSDNSIIEILGVEDGNSKFITNVLIKAKEPGITNIVLAAPGFSSKEIALEVFNNNNYPTQILMKITPEEFPIDGPKHGYVAIELATTGGLPTRAIEDVEVKLETPNKDVIKLEDVEVKILSGEYYVISKFEIIGSGDAIIFAETEGMEKISKIVKVLEATTPLKLQLHVFPKNFNSFSGTSGYAIVQLLDGDGLPMLAEEEINFQIEIENPNVSINSSHDFEEVIFDNNQLVIEKGSYSTWTKFTPRPNIGDFTEEFSQTYNMYISADNLLTSGDSFTISHDEEAGSLEGEGPSVTKVIPFLTTGKKEIIAVTYYETDIEVSRQTGGSSAGSTNREIVTVTVPVQAREDHEINVSSSEIDTVDAINPIMKKGENVVIIYGETGTIAPEDPLTFYITDNEGVKTTSGNPVGPIRDDISLTTESLLPMILAEDKFPSIAYLNEGGETDEEEIGTTEGDEGEEEGSDARTGITPFIEDGVLTFSANEFVDVNSIEIKKNQPYALIDMISKEVGITTLDYQMGGFDGNMEISSHTTDPSEIHLAFSKNIIANSKTLATVQLLDSVGNPVYSKKDMQVKIVSSDEQILKAQEEVTIGEGDYFITFELETLNEGGIELSLLSEDFALSKYDVNIVDITPVLSLDLLGGLGWNERIEAKMQVSIPEIETALDGFVVEWETDGGEIRSIQEVTNNEGLAILNIIANEKETVTITAKVSGNGLSPATITKTATITGMPVEEVVDETSSRLELPIDVNLIILIIIPVAIAGALFTLKRLDKLDLITEKIPLGDKLNIGDKFEEIKERVSDIRNR